MELIFVLKLKEIKLLLYLLVVKLKLLHEKDFAAH